VAGRRHHHVWQMLQRGFSSQANGDHHVWVYRNGKAPEKTVTRKFGRITDFYGSEADANITDFENSIQGFIQECRLMKHGDVVDPSLSSSLISHLEMRSLFLRDELSRLSDRVAQTIKQILSSRNDLSILMTSYLRSHPEILYKELERAGFSEEIRSIALDLAIENLPNFIANGANSMVLGSRQIVGTICASMANIAKSAHNKSLEGDFSELERTKHHLSMKFSILKVKDGSLILPDTTLAFLKENGCAPISKKYDKISTVIIPISSHVAIVGNNDGSPVRDLKTIRRVLASCAYEAFLSKEYCVELNNLSKRIGRNAKLVSQAELNSWLSLDRILENW
jgi:hypothetical protein